MKTGNGNVYLHVFRNNLTNLFVHWSLISNSYNQLSLGDCVGNAVTA